MEISSEFLGPGDVLKTRLVDKNWIGVEELFKKITPKAEIFLNKQTNDIVFEIKRDFQVEIAEILGLNDERAVSVQEFIEAKNWNKLFHKLIQWKSCFQDFLDALAEIVEVNVLIDFVGTSVHLAATWRTTSLLKILLNRNETNPNVKDKFGETALHRAAKNNKVNHIEILLRHKAQVDATDDGLRTPLMLVSNNVDGTLATAVVLLVHGADPNKRDEFGQTALHFAVANNKEVFLPVLSKYGAQIDKTDYDLTAQLLIMGFEI